MATDTTVPSYWLNWRVLLCAIWIASSMIFAAIIIWMYEGRNASRTRADGAAGALNKGDSWCTCFKSIHPIWLLVFRIAAFCVMLSLILADTILHSVGIFYHYTKWTFTMVTIYFGICAGAVVLTDFVYWLVLYPLYTGSGYKLTFLDVCMHSVNAVFLLGDTILNSMKFPFFRIAYFALYTCAFVIFQWIIHVFVSMSWPYTFLDLSSPNAPLWYLCVGLLHLPCFGIFYLLFKMKQHYLSKL